MTITENKPSTTGRFPVILAFLTVCIVWGSTFLAIREAVATIPPFLMAGMRYISAGTIFYAWVRPRFPRPTAANWKAALGVAALLLVGGNGLLSWGEQFIPSGLAALIVATFPVWAVLIDWLWYRQSKPVAAAWTALVMGLAGVYLLVDPFALDLKSAYAKGIIAVMVGSLSWAIGSTRSRHVALPAPMLSAAMQMMLGGTILLILGFATGEGHGLRLAQISCASIYGLLYLIFAGSILGFGAYVYLLHHAPPTKAATYAFVNPLVAIALGCLLGHETLETRDLIAGALIVASVAIATLGGKKAVIDER